MFCSHLSEFSNNVFGLPQTLSIYLHTSGSSFANILWVRTCVVAFFRCPSGVRAPAVGWLLDRAEVEPPGVCGLLKARTPRDFFLFLS